MLFGKGRRKRYIPINETLFQVLNDIYKGGAQYPFSFKPDFVSHKIVKYYKKAGIENANLHSLRKTFGSILLQNGKADIYTVSRLLGHSSIKTTERYYVDLLDDNYRASVDGFDDIL